MTAGTRRVSIPPTWRAVKGAIAASIPALAWAQQKMLAVATSPLEEISAISWAGMIFFSLAGWAVADIDKLAELWNAGDGTAYHRALTRLKLLKTLLGSLLAGVFTYWLGKISPEFIFRAMNLQLPEGRAPEIHEFLLLIACAGAGWQGARWFEKLFGR